jgi:hypothetical protein
MRLRARRPEEDACDVQSGHVDGCGLLVGGDASSPRFRRSMHRSARLCCFACRRPVPTVSPAVTVNGHAGWPGRGSPRGPCACAGSGRALERCTPCGPGLHPALCGARPIGQGARTQTVTSAKAGASSAHSSDAMNACSACATLSPGPLCPCLIHTGPIAGLGVWHPCNRDQRLGPRPAREGPGPAIERRSRADRRPSHALSKKLRSDHFGIKSVVRAQAFLACPAVAHLSP